MFDQLKALSQLGPIMAQAKQMQQKMQEAHARLPQIRATGTAGGSLVTATANGNLEITNITYLTSAMGAGGGGLTDPELLADLTRAAVNQALKNVKELVQKEMQQAMGLPEGMDPSSLPNIAGLMGQ